MRVDGGKKEVVLRRIVLCVLAPLSLNFRASEALSVSRQEHVFLCGGVAIGLKLGTCVKSAV